MTEGFGLVAYPARWGASGIMTFVVGPDGRVFEKNLGPTTLMYASAMMAYAVGRFLPPGADWRELFDVIVVGARKPDFFTSRGPLFEVATDEGLLRSGPRALLPGKIYFGGSASQVGVRVVKTQ